METSVGMRLIDGSDLVWTKTTLPIPKGFERTRVSDDWLKIQIASQWE